MPLEKKGSHERTNVAVTNYKVHICSNKEFCKEECCRITLRIIEIASTPLSTRMWRNIPYFLSLWSTIKI